MTVSTISTYTCIYWLYNLQCSPSTGIVCDTGRGQKTVQITARLEVESWWKIQVIILCHKAVVAELMAAPATLQVEQLLENKWNVTQKPSWDVARQWLNNTTRLIKKNDPCEISNPLWSLQACRIELVHPQLPRVCLTAVGKNEDWLEHPPHLWCHKTAAALAGTHRRECWGSQ